jgi:hypothetical protein
MGKDGMNGPGGCRRKKVSPAIQIIESDMTQ